MRKKVNVPALVGVGIVLMLLLLVVVFRSMPAISMNYVGNNFERLTFVKDGEVINVEDFEQLDQYSMDVDRSTSTVYSSEKAPTSVILPPFYGIVHID